jgi:N-acetylneuraminate synthase/sialic acid synthase
VPTTHQDRVLEIDGTKIHDDSDCFVIAEIGHNHQGSVEQAKELFRAAKEAGADAVKLQKRHNRSLYTRDYFTRPYENDNSFGKTYGEHREALEFGREEYIELQAYAGELEITFFATAFDAPSCEFLAELDMPAYKMASADIKNTPLLRCVASVGKPMIISTGAALVEDVRRAYETVAEINPNVAVLQCTAGYPATWDELDLRVIESYRNMFPGAVVGLSSHDNGIAMAVAAYVLGARIVEKHFTLDRAKRGSDHAFSLEPQGLGKMVRDLGRLHKALGDGEKRMYESEAAPALKMAKKLVASRDLPAGHVLSEEDFSFKSPGDGLPPCDMELLIGRRLRQPIAEEMEYTLQHVEELEPRPTGERMLAADAV